MICKAELERALKALHTSLGYAIDEFALLDLAPDYVDHGNYDVDGRAISEAWTRIHAMRVLWQIQLREQEFLQSQQEQGFL